MIVFDALQVTFAAKTWRTSHGTVATAVDRFLTIDPHVHDCPYGVAFATATLLLDLRGPKLMTKALVAVWSNVLARILANACVSVNHSEFCPEKKIKTAKNLEFGCWCRRVGPAESLFELSP